MERLILTLMLMLAVMTSCTQRKASENSDTGLLEFTAEMDAFQSFAGHFSENSSFAFADVGGVQVLLVSQETFGNNINSDREAIEASVFALDSKGKIIIDQDTINIYNQNIDKWYDYLAMNEEQKVKAKKIDGDDGNITFSGGLNREMSAAYSVAFQPADSL